MLQCGGQTSGAFIQGELDWMPMCARRVRAAFREWGRILMMTPTRLIRQVFLACRERSDRLHGNFRGDWAGAVARLLREYGLGEFAEVARFEGGQMSWTEWCGIVDTHLATKVAADWGAKMAARPALALYSRLKEKPGLEEYLVVMAGVGRRVAAQMRAGTYPCGDYYRSWKKRPEHLTGGVCQLCAIGKVEDVHHLLCECRAYDKDRMDFWVEAQHHLGVDGWGCLESMGADQWHIVLGRAVPGIAIECWREILQCAGAFLAKLHARRLSLMAALGDFEDV